MVKKPVLVIFNNYIITGIGSFFSNLLSHDPYRNFHKKVIQLSNDAWPDAKMNKPFGLTEEEEIFVIKQEDQETVYDIAKRLHKHIPKGPGAIVTNFNAELFTLHLYPQKEKTVYFVCHDDNHLKHAVQYSFLIDVFMAHNPAYAVMMKEQMPERANDVYYIPYGIDLPLAKRAANPDKTLNVVWLARLFEHKGIRRIPGIDEKLKQKCVKVNWTIIGDGPEKADLLKNTEDRDNFSFHTPADFAGVAQLLSAQDVYILPSRLDGLPVALIEAMSVGCVPVISAFNQGMKQIVTQDMGFVLPVGDDEGFADAIALLDKDRNLLEKLSDTARNKTRENYDINTQARKYFDLFGNFQQLKRVLPRKMPLYRGLLVYYFIPRAWRGKLRKLLKK